MRICLFHSICLNFQLFDSQCLNFQLFDSQCLFKTFRDFQHENLVGLYGVCTQQGPMFIVTELMVNGECCCLGWLHCQHWAHMVAWVVTMLLGYIQRRLDTYSLTCAVTCHLQHLITFRISYQHAICSPRG